MCKRCEKLPKDELESRLAHEELTRLEQQANLSAQNTRRLEVLVRSDDDEVREKADVLLAVSRLHPHKSKRLPWLLERDPALHGRYIAAFAKPDAPEPDEAEADAPSAAEAEAPAAPEADAPAAAEAAGPAPDETDAPAPAEADASGSS